MDRRYGMIEAADLILLQEAKRRGMQSGILSRLAALVRWAFL